MLSRTRQRNNTDKRQPTTRLADPVGACVQKRVRTEGEREKNKLVLNRRSMTFWCFAHVTREEEWNRNGGRE